MMVVDNKFEIGQIVYLKTDAEQQDRMVVVIEIYKFGLMYRLNCGSVDSIHFEFEITNEKNFVKK